MAWKWIGFSHYRLRNDFIPRWNVPSTSATDDVIHSPQAKTDEEIVIISSDIVVEPALDDEGKKGRKVGVIRYEARSRGRSSPDTLAFWACEMPRR